MAHLVKQGRMGNQDCLENLARMVCQERMVEREIKESRGLLEEMVEMG